MKRIEAIVLFGLTCLAYIFSSVAHAETAKIEFRSVSVQGYDGPARGQFMVTPMVTLRDVSLNGQKLPKNYISFELEGDLRSDELNLIGFNKLGLIEEISASVASQKNHPKLGNRFYFYANVQMHF